jgi:hypothetical protein
LTPAGGNFLPRKPNYKFERLERDRAKAAKKAARLQAKEDRRGVKPGEDGSIATAADDGATISSEPEEAPPGTD